MPLYEQIHKAIRKKLFDMSILIGITDFTNQHEFIQLQANFNELINLLEAHAGHEENFVHPLLSKQTLEAVEKDHASQHKVLHDLKKQLSDINDHNGNIRNSLGHVFYMIFNRFISTYLSHLYEEETAVSTELRKNYSDDQLLNAIHKMLTSFTSEEKIQSYEMVLPAVNLVEQVNMFTHLTIEAFDQYLTIAERVLSPQQSQQLLNEITKAKCIT